MFSVSKFCSSSFNRCLLSNLCQSTFFLQQRCVKSVALDRLPEKPKRPPSIWNIYMKERCQELQELADKDMSFTEMSTKISEEWRELDEVDKIPYKEKYGEFMSEYRHKMEEYKTSLTPEDKQLLLKIKNKKDEKQESKIFEKLFPKPRFPGNGYTFFVKSYLTENPQDASKDMKQRIRDCASKWQSLEDETKQSFNEKVLPLMVNYREELKDWKEKYQEWKTSDTSSN